MSQTSDSQLSEGGLNKIVDDVQPQSTDRSTKWGVTKLEAWLAKRAIMCDFQCHRGGAEYGVEAVLRGT